MQIRLVVDFAVFVQASSGKRSGTQRRHLVNVPLRNFKTKKQAI